MWFEIIPSFSICLVCLTIPIYANIALHKIFLGNKYMRSIATPDERYNVLRDERLTGSSYKTLGLDDLPDEAEQKSQ